MSSHIMQYPHGMQEENNGDHGVPESSKLGGGSRKASRLHILSVNYALTCARVARGPHGFGKMNDAGKELLSFLSLNEATACNTWFQKNDIYKCTWQHPKSKSWHCIDYAIVRARDRRRCLDASVKRGAECNTDHQLLRIKLHMSQLYQTAMTSASPHRFDISKLVGPSLDKDGKNTPRGQFQKSAKEQWKVDGSIQDKWVTIHSDLTEAAKSTLGVEKRRHPD